MAYIAKTRFPASGYDVDKWDYIPTIVIGQAHSSLLSAGYIAEVPDDPEKERKFFDERGNLLDPNVTGGRDPRELIPGVTPLPYETHSNVNPMLEPDDERTEGKRELDPSSAAAGGNIGIDQAPLAGAGLVPEELSAADEPGKGDVADEELQAKNAEADATDGAKDLANEEGIDLEDVKGSGDGGRVQKTDVEEYLDEKA